MGSPEGSGLKCFKLFILKYKALPTLNQYNRVPQSETKDSIVLNGQSTDDQLKLSSTCHTNSKRQDVDFSIFRNLDSPPQYYSGTNLSSTSTSSTIPIIKHDETTTLLFSTITEHNPQQESSIVNTNKIFNNNQYETDNILFDDGDGNKNRQNSDEESNIMLINETETNFLQKKVTNNLDAIVEDSSEEIDEQLLKCDQISIKTHTDIEHQPVAPKIVEELSNLPIRIPCDRDIFEDCNDLYAKLDNFNLNETTQFNNEYDLSSEFTRHVGKLKNKMNDVVQATQMPRDAELLEARYSSLLATIENLSVLLKIGEIHMSRAIINRLIFNIEQRIEQLKKISNINKTKFDSLDDFCSVRSALSSYEHLFT
ncbi:unnamed protein product [Didymodactylos carnosus]|uniref:Uncharacterized protein n=1 Tax=Didymodactylos carnosus TaxID=1234261 RepID=A0A8S2H045_9BILA|nr:unnamed protein product [Didymodactylos carnosus]CAF3578660.1 unnamed protein product [Didymodactylos carnosus]